MALFQIYQGGYKVLTPQCGSFKGERAERMIKDFPDTFMGIYTPDCPLEWLESDLE